MKLSNREKIGLSLLGILLIGFMYYRWLFLPQSSTLKSFAMELNKQEEEKIRIQTILAQEPELQEKFEMVTQNIKKYDAPFFTKIHQQDIIVLLQELENPFPFEITEMSFSEINDISWMNENEEEHLGQELTVFLTYDGTYDGIMHFLKKIEDYPKKIITNQIRLQQSSIPDRLTGTITLRFLGFSQWREEKPLFQWDQNVTLVQNNLADPWIQKIEKQENTNQNREEENQWTGLDWEEPMEKENPAVVEESLPSMVKKTSIFHFQPKSVFFVGEPEEVEGTRQALEDHLLVEYHFLRDVGYRKINMVIEDSVAVIPVQPLYVIVPVYSFAKEIHGIGMVLKDALGKEKNLILTSTIDWVGWKEFKAELPIDLTYPVTLSRIYIETPTTSPYGAKGKLLFDTIDILETDEE